MRKNCLNYPVEVVEDAFAEGNIVLSDMLKKVTGEEKPRVMLVADQNVVSRTEGLGMRIGRWVQANGIELACTPVILAGGERVKDDEMRTAKDLVQETLKAKIGKTDVMLAIGGGTLLDVAGWSASQTRGGIPIVRMPTTPAAMVDAAFAEYAALDCLGVKDAMRVTCTPAGVVVDTTFVATVLDGVWRAGFAAAMRLAAVSDAALVKKLAKLAPAYRERDAAAMRAMVESTIAARMKKGGTTFALWSAHRLESMSGYKLPYGYAIALGIFIDTAYAVQSGLMAEEDRKLICDAVAASGAMEGALHSRHLLAREEMVLFGLDAWHLANGTDAIQVPSGVGKVKTEENPNRDTMKRAINLLK